MEGRHALLAVLSIFAVASCANGFCRTLMCPEDNGYFAHPQSCVGYVKCVEGKAYVKECPANLHFNEATGMCDRPANSRCSEAAKQRVKDCIVSHHSKHSRNLGSSPAPGIQCDCGKCCRKPNPSNCTTFYECDENGNAYLKSCSPGLVYNPATEDCDLSSNYQCPDVPDCHCKCRYPVDGECDAFYKCEEEGKPAVKEYCSEGLEFNPETETCDQPNNVDCPPGPIPTPEPENCKDQQADCKYWTANGDCKCDPAKSGDCSWQHYVQRNCPLGCGMCSGGGGGGGGGGDDSGGSSSEEHGGGCEDGNVDCCDIDCSKQQYWPHPTNCEKFIQCTPYGPQEMPCGPETRWDQSLLTCGHKESTPCKTGSYKTLTGSDCGGGGGGSGSGSGSHEHGGGSGSGSGSHEHGGGSGSGEDGGCGDGNVECCDVDCSKQQYWPHPTNCEKFIQCTPYGPQEMPCGPETRWDQSLLTCGHKESTPCKTGSYKTLTGSDCGGGGGGGGSGSGGSGSGSHEHSGGSGSGSGSHEHGGGSGSGSGSHEHGGGSGSGSGSHEHGGGSGSGEDGGCGDGNVDCCDIDCSKQQYWPHPTNCEKFIQCAPYGPQEMPCGPETRWDQSLLTCGHKESTPCKTGSYKTLTGSDCGGGGGGGGGGSGEDCDIVCPKPNGEFPHPSYCNKWVHCSNNIPYVKDCPANLYFDATLKVCNWPQDTVCWATQNPGCDVPYVPPVTPTPINPPEVCDCDCCLRPHPDDCTSYYYCDGTNTEFHTCSEGLVFDPVNETCVYAKDYPECQPDVPPECECECLYPSTICSEYFKCVDNKPKKLECPNGLYYNPDTKACDKPENVDCKMPARRRSGLLNRRQQPIAPSECTKLPNGRYPSEKSSEFFNCFNGVAFLLRCQDGTSFHPGDSKCVRK